MGKVCKSMCVDIFRKEIAIVINASHTIGMLLF